MVATGRPDLAMVNLVLSLEALDWFDRITARSMASREVVGSAMDE